MDPKGLINKYELNKETKDGIILKMKGHKAVICEIEIAQRSNEKK